MRRHEAQRSPTHHMKNRNHSNHSSKKQDEVIEDVSGENWDEAALNAIESITHSEEPNETETRGEEPKELPKPDLTHANLHGADLRTADLSGTVLAKANLSEARLDQAKLDNADLRGADLRSCNLSEAHLNDTKLYGAFFNQKTLLPFDKGEALRRGMIFFDIEPD